MQFIVLGKDGTDDGALERRLAVRDQHIAMGDAYHAEGKHLIGAAMLNDAGTMCGSVLVVDFPTREELDAWLEKEPYVTGNVWKDVEVIPCKVGPTFLASFSRYGSRVD